MKIFGLFAVALLCACATVPAVTSTPCPELPPVHPVPGTRDFTDVLKQGELVQCPKDPTVAIMARMFRDVEVSKIDFNIAHAIAQDYGLVYEGCLWAGLLDYYFASPVTNVDLAYTGMRFLVVSYYNAFMKRFQLDRMHITWQLNVDGRTPIIPTQFSPAIDDHGVPADTSPSPSPGPVTE